LTKKISITHVYANLYYIVMNSGYQLCFTTL